MMAVSLQGHPEVRSYQRVMSRKMEMGPNLAQRIRRLYFPLFPPSVAMLHFVLCRRFPRTHTTSGWGGSWVCTPLLPNFWGPRDGVPHQPTLHF